MKIKSFNHFPPVAWSTRTNHGAAISRKIRIPQGSRASSKSCQSRRTATKLIRISAESRGKTHGPFVHAYRDLRNNQNKPEVEYRFISVEAPVDGRNNPLAFDEHDAGNFRIARLYRRPEIPRAEEGQKYQSRQHYEIKRIAIVGIQDRMCRRAEIKRSTG